jgi:uncharacterized protein (TIGR02996 family)
MTIDAAFLDAIIASPDEDAPRLVYADFLEEHGQPERAEFIRLQCELAKTPAGERRKALEAKERALLEAHQETWVWPLMSPLLHWTFRRGFVEGLAHSGIFQRTETFLDDEGYRVWTYLRFYADGDVIFVASDGNAAQVVRWFRRGYDPIRRSELPKGKYRLDSTHSGVKVSFALKAGYGTGFGLLDFSGTVGVESGAVGVRLMMDVFNHDENETARQMFSLVEVPGYDSASE